MSSLTRTLISRGFSDLETSERFLGFSELADIDQGTLLDALSVADNPDLALQSLVRLLSAVPEARTKLTMADPEGGEPISNESLFRLLGASEALAEFLMRHPEHLDVVDGVPSIEPMAADAAGLRASVLRAVGADTAAEMPTAAMTGITARLALRSRYRRHLCELAVRDLGAASPQSVMPLVGAELADLAAAALEGALAVARAEVGEAQGSDKVAAVRFAVLGMGKCGARELNYISDVDVMYVVESVVDPATGASVLDEGEVVKVGSAMATALSRAIYAPEREPGLWEVDANLRPEGKDGQLVRTLDSYLAYYQRWAQSWEFQALLKARTIAGDQSLGESFEAAVAPLIWASSEREGFVESVQAMRRRVTANIRDSEADRQIKLGKGGLRDVEFTVQLLQLVHGKNDPSLRIRSTTAAIDALTKAGYIGRTDAALLRNHYTYLRVLEHRIQLVQMRRTHMMPTAPEQLRALARSLEGPLSLKRPSADSLLADWARVKRSVSSLHEQIFYRPILATAAHLSAEDAALTSDAARARLAALGYRDAAGATRHIEALTAGVSRRAALQRQLLPVLLGWLADGVDPDAGLLAFRRVSDALGTSHWYLGMLRDHQAAAERLCYLLSSSRLVSDLLEVSPEATAWLGNSKELVPVSFESQWTEIQSKLSRHREGSEAIRLIRLLRQREILRIGIADSCSLLAQDEVSAALSDTDRAAVLGALMVAEEEIYAGSEPLTQVLVVAMGRQGGREIGYGSDADVLFVHQPVADLPESQNEAATQQAKAIVQRLTALLTAPLRPAIQAERVLSVDADLRPEGRNGPLVRSLEAYREYYARWSSTWEAQALLRALPMAGSDAVAEGFVAMADPIRYPQSLSEDGLREIKRIKARMESERLPRGADPARHVKLGRGGLSDVEWLVQLLQLKHAHTYAELRTTQTLPALHAAQALGLVDAADAEILESAWRLAGRIRNANVMWTGTPSDLLPTARRDLEAVARLCGYEQGSAAVFEENYLSLTRRARAVFERLFYG
ncbi:bifunctional [glutamine synthetase] adenylyltransferase/[glutamine synthetase]-adenylyl-L-tyrosine phosphorylase [Arthrobacter psychrolactophilus]|uniref:Bifunctional [glutamine synthetase] adenylyltransferase/[glutamine synthetase]-adenylyl-L-tyrosine phosphorylase n=1 Tax=Arthrobacter psychrolactophilus TaxID=92442 RepID=A0A2V5IWJ0_9MICC|nr:bifunctional [glutamine synthetase] adenylyltransferase/[glutamine synthetase]-adenylyl-L-tyrosine phosphorylase [Arthrobacter psychrolactophilus]PYI38604.1 bifunctional [glutamine synthetase] adenylyltransferase/[glutamine synthetase]-adenylyl-L-tyrosine phosphorylase [Arthrobacter psychrolactophilus]